MLVTTFRSRVRLARSANYLPKAEPVLPQQPTPKVTEILSQVTNPLSDIIDDSTYKALIENELIDSRQLRNYQIRKAYYSLKTMLGSAGAIEYLQKNYPHLQYDTIRKIIYKAA